MRPGGTQGCQGLLTRVQLKAIGKPKMGVPALILGRLILHVIWTILAVASFAMRAITGLMRRMMMVRTSTALILVALLGIRGVNATIPKSSEQIAGTGILDEMLRMANLVETQNACALPGCTIKYDSFMHCMRRAQSRGYVEDRYADFVADGLRNGFTCGVDRSRVAGKRVFRNYKTALDARAAVTKAIGRRVERSKSLALGPWAAVEKALCAIGGHSP